eukprot:1309593-Heterocapsa_arctica.AAC.1
MRRSGWGVWVQEGHPLNSFGVVPGPEQTAGRAELYASVKVLERTSSDVFMIIDHKACVHNMMEDSSPREARGPPQKSNQRLRAWPT